MHIRKVFKLSCFNSAKQAQIAWAKVYHSVVVGKKKVKLIAFNSDSNAYSSCLFWNFGWCAHHLCTPQCTVHAYMTVCLSVSLTVCVERQYAFWIYEKKRLAFFHMLKLNLFICVLELAKSNRISNLIESVRFRCAHFCI